MTIVTLTYCKAPHNCQVSNKRRCSKALSVSPAGQSTAVVRYGNYTTLTLIVEGARIEQLTWAVIKLMPFFQTKAGRFFISHIADYASVKLTSCLSPEARENFAASSHSDGRKIVQCNSTIFHSMQITSSLSTSSSSS